MIFLNLLCILSCMGVQGIKIPPAQLQIGIKKKIDPCPTEKTKKGDKLQMHYRGTLFGSDEEFDSSFSRNQPFEFTLGVGQVIQGWDSGLLDMCPGEKRKLVIPPHVGYGERGAGEKIPPGSTLVFEVELLKILQKGSKRPFSMPPQFEDDGHDHPHDDQDGHPEHYPDAPIDPNDSFGWDNIGDLDRLADLELGHDEEDLELGHDEEDL